MQRPKCVGQPFPSGAGLARRDVHTGLPWSSLCSMVGFGIMPSMGDTGQEGGCAHP